MKVFEIGHGKTGSNSLTEAMKQLGFKSVHWPLENLEYRQEYFDFLAKKTNKVSFFDDFDFISNGLHEGYELLDIKYPNAKFILNVRCFLAWLKSYEKHLEKWPDEDITYRNFGVEKFNQQVFLKVYLAHNNAVVKYFSLKYNKSVDDKLLVFNPCAGEGFDKLTSFLKLPSFNKEFPNISV